MIRYKPFDFIEIETSMKNIKKIIKEIYEYEPSDKTIYIDEWYINFIFDEFCDKWYASTYIELNNTYLRIERNEKEIISIIKGDLKLT